MIKNTLRHFWQPVVALICVFIALLIMGGFVNTAAPSLIGIASLGATGFILFCAPYSKFSTAKVVLGSYLLSVLFGVVFLQLAMAMSGHAVIAHLQFFQEFCAVMAMGCCVLGMLFLNVEHPPAVGLALGLVVESWPIPVLIVILSTVLLMVVLKYLLRRYMVNLY